MGVVADEAPYNQANGYYVAGTGRFRTQAQMLAQGWTSSLATQTGGFGPVTSTWGSAQVGAPAGEPARVFGEQFTHEAESVLTSDGATFTYPYWTSTGCSAACVTGDHNMPVPRGYIK